MDHSGLQQIACYRLSALINQLSREILLAEGYPDVQARLKAHRIRAQVELNELNRTPLQTLMR